MSTKAAEQQRKQRQKEFKEKKEHEERVKAGAKKAKTNLVRKLKRVPIILFKQIS